MPVQQRMTFVATKFRSELTFENFYTHTSVSHNFLKVSCTVISYGIFRSKLTFEKCLPVSQLPHYHSELLRLRKMAVLRSQLPNSAKVSSLQHCDTLQHAEIRCNTLQRDEMAVWRSQLQHSAKVSSLHHTATRCNALQYVATRCNTQQHDKRVVRTAKLREN